MVEHKLYTGAELLALPKDLNRPLIDGLIWERDNIFLVGRAKIGKSIFAQQIAFSISSGEPFLSQYKTNKGCCLYLQAEGKLSETRDRILNMLEGVSWDASNFNLVFYPGLALNTSNGIRELKRLIDNKVAEGMPIPKLIILDPLYMWMAGDLSNQAAASTMCQNMRVLTSHYDCALMVIHHEHKLRRNDKGDLIKEGDESIFGSFVWQAFPDHILIFSRLVGNYRELSCTTQRSAKVIKKLELSMLDPTPLMFEIRGDVAPYIKVIEKNLRSNFAIMPQELVDITGLSYNSVKRALAYLRKANLIEKEGTSYPVKWKLIKKEVKNGKIKKMPDIV